MLATLDRAHYHRLTTSLRARSHSGPEARGLGELAAQGTRGGPGFTPGPERPGAWGAPGAPHLKENP